MSGAPPIESPCVRVCRMQPGAHVCEGCLRTAEEIAGWLAYTPAERRRIMADLGRRRAGPGIRLSPGGNDDVV